MINLHTESTNDGNRQPLDWQLTLDCIKETIKTELPSSQILLFGSHARGDFSRTSDYDLLIMTQEPIDVKTKMPLKTRIRKSLLAQGIFSDILIQSTEEVERKRHLPGHVVRNAIKEGIAL